MDKRSQKTSNTGGCPPVRPLEGIRVISTGIIVAQPYMATKMAEFGAEVIHVERPGGDPSAGWPL